MYYYSEKSKSVLATAHKDLQRLFNAVIEDVDISILEAHRGEEKQNSLYPEFTRVLYPYSGHNKVPALAVDWKPYIKGATKEHYIYAAGIIMTKAKLLRIDIVWGGNWDRDGEVLTDQKFNDLGHVELI